MGFWEAFRTLASALVERLRRRQARPRDFRRTHQGDDLRPGSRSEPNEGAGTRRDSQSETTEGRGHSATGDGRADQVDVVPAEAVPSAASADTTSAPVDDVGVAARVEDAAATEVRVSTSGSDDTHSAQADEGTIASSAVLVVAPEENRSPPKDTGESAAARLTTPESVTASAERDADADAPAPATETITVVGHSVDDVETGQVNAGPAKAMAVEDPARAGDSQTAVADVRTGDEARTDPDVGGAGAEPSAAVQPPTARVILSAVEVVLPPTANGNVTPAVADADASHSEPVPSASAPAQVPVASRDDAPSSETTPAAPRGDAALAVQSRPSVAMQPPPTAVTSSALEIVLPSRTNGTVATEDTGVDSSSDNGTPRGGSDTLGTLPAARDSSGEEQMSEVALAASTVSDSALPLQPIARRARKYRPVPRTPPAQRRSTADVGTTAGTTTPAERQRSLRIELRLRKELGGAFACSLIPRRDASSPQQITVRGDKGLFNLIALQDDWYQDTAPDNLGELLRTGVVWSAVLEGELISWNLSGRQIFVLVQHQHLSGFVSTPRLTLGERHIVLCTAELADAVESAIRATGAATCQRLGLDDGIPHGWCGFSDVLPRAPRATSTEGDIFDVLCPPPDVEILLDGGIPLRRNVWLAGFPPSIRLTGDAQNAGALHIDGAPAGFDGSAESFRREGWDAIGTHTVWCAGKTATYSIATGIEDWDAWPVHCWTLGEGESSSEANDRPVICGALALSPAEALAKPRKQAVIVPTSNPVLLGSVPGEIYFGEVRRDVRAAQLSAFPPFAPIWALPSDPLHANRDSVRILLVGEMREPLVTTPSNSPRIAAWCSHILAASKKRMQLDPASAEILSLWSSYRRLARDLWRKQR